MFLIELCERKLGNYNKKYLFSATKKAKTICPTTNNIITACFIEIDNVQGKLLIIFNMCIRVQKLTRFGKNYLNSTQKPLKSCILPITWQIWEME